MDNENQQIPPVPDQTPAKIANNLSFAKTLAYGFAIASVGVAIAIGGYFLGANKTKSQPVVQTSIIPSVSPTPDPTASWQTYANSQYKYQIRYPNQWSFEDNKTETNFYPPGPYTYDPQDVVGRDQIWIDVNDNPQNLSIGNFVVVNQMWMTDVNFKTFKSIEVNGAEAERGILPGGIAGLNTSDVVYIKKNLYIYSISYKLAAKIDKNTFDQMLSTFKFTN